MDEATALFDDRVSEVTCSIGSRVCGSRFSVCACVERGSRNCVHVQVMEMRWELYLHVIGDARSEKAGNIIKRECKKMLSV